MVRIRELGLDDYAAVAALNTRNGLRAAPESDWRRLWVDNPSANEFREVPCGWVMEDSCSRVVGAACNVPVMYDMAGRSVRTSTGMAWAVDEAHRNASLLLLEAFFSQNHVDLLLNTTANPVAGKAWQAFRAQKLPQCNYDRNFIWITQYLAFARTIALRMRLRGIRLLQIPLAGCLVVQDFWRSLHSIWDRSRQLDHAVQRLDIFDCRFDAFWETLKATGDGRLRATRDSRSLEWHFRPALQREEVFILACPGDSPTAIDGYLIARRNDRDDIRLRRYQIADLQVRPGRDELIPALVAKALHVAKQERADVVELTGFEMARYPLSEALPHRTRQLPTWPYFFKSLDPYLASLLQNPDAWDASPFDGDATL